MTIMTLTSFVKKLSNSAACQSSTGLLLPDSLARSASAASTVAVHYVTKMSLISRAVTMTYMNRFR